MLSALPLVTAFFHSPLIFFTFTVADAAITSSRSHPITVCCLPCSCFPHVVHTAFKVEDHLLPCGIITPPIARHHDECGDPPPHLYDDNHSCLSMSAAVALSEGSNRSIGRIKFAHSSASSLGNPYLSTSTSEMPQ